MSIFGLSLAYRVRGQEDTFDLQRVTAAFERAGQEFTADKFGSRVFPRLIPILEAAVKKQFDARGEGPNRGAWKPLSEAYAKWKAEHYPGKGILERTGALRKALTEEGSSYAQRVFSGGQLNFGTSGLPYASHHQEGAGRMPDRPVFDFGPDFAAAFHEAAELSAREAMREARLDELGTVKDETGVSRQIQTGSRGGRFYVSGSGRKVYV